MKRVAHYCTNYLVFPGMRTGTSSMISTRSSLDSQCARSTASPSPISTIVFPSKYSSLGKWRQAHPVASISFGRGRHEIQLLADTVFCQAFFGLPSGAVPFTTNLVRSASPFLSTCPCHLSLHLLITSPITSTPRCLLITSPITPTPRCLLGSVRETPHIHLIILCRFHDEYFK